jgi:hypothetical protein
MKTTDLLPLDLPITLLDFRDLFAEFLELPDEVLLAEILDPDADPIFVPVVPSAPHSSHPVRAPGA